MTVKDLKAGQAAVIETVGGEGALRQHFLDMGLIPGAEVCMVKLAPMGDPMELKIHGYELTLRLADAAKIDRSSAAIYPTEEAPAAPVRNTPHPGLGEGGKYHVKAGEHPLPEGCNAHLCAGGQPELRQDDTVQPASPVRNQHVGNFPGVTVDRKDGVIRGHPETLVTDLPGIYSMSPYTQRGDRDA